MIVFFCLVGLANSRKRVEAIKSIYRNEGARIFVREINKKYFGIEKLVSWGE